MRICKKWPSSAGAFQARSRSPAQGSGTKLACLLNALSPYSERFAFFIAAIAAYRKANTRLFASKLAQSRLSFQCVAQCIAKVPAFAEGPEKCHASSGLLVIRESPPPPGNSRCVARGAAASGSATSQAMSPPCRHMIIQQSEIVPCEKGQRLARCPLFADTDRLRHTRSSPVSHGNADLSAGSAFPNRACRATLSRSAGCRPPRSAPVVTSLFQE